MQVHSRNIFMISLKRLKKTVVQKFCYNASLRDGQSCCYFIVSFLQFFEVFNEFLSLVDDFKKDEKCYLGRSVHEVFHCVLYLLRYSNRN